MTKWSNSTGASRIGRRLRLPCGARARRTAAASVVLLALSLGTAPAGQAQDRLVRRFAGDEGLPVPPVSALAQDPTGFLWIGTQGGLYRYDGVEFLRWAAGRIPGPVGRLDVAPDGRLAVQRMDGAIMEVVGDSVAPLPPPPGGWPAEAESLAFDGSGRLWTVTGDSTVVVRDAGAWTAVPRERLDGEGARRVRAVEGGGVLVLTDAGLWAFGEPGSTPRKRFGSMLTDAIALPDGRLILLTVYGDVVALAGGRTRVLASKAAGQIPPARPIALAERNGTIWVSFDRYLVAVRPGVAPEIIGPDDGLESGGPLLVDHEGSLWLGAYSALFQYPEPETAVWNDRNGLPGRHTRYLARSGDVLWVTTWQGTGRVRRTETGLQASSVRALESSARPCADSLGVVWLSTRDAVVRLRGDSIIARLPYAGGFDSCWTAAGSRLWIGTTAPALLLADPIEGSFRRVAAPRLDGSIHAVLEDRRGRLWVASRERVCHAPADAVATGADADWACETVPGSGTITSLIALSDGTIWASTRHAAVLARDRDGWRPIPAAARLASLDVFTLVASPRGGVWIAGHGILQRVRPGGPEGWEVLEAPGPRNGLPAVGGGDLHEDEDGTLWITTSIGLLRVPTHARFARNAPPRVVLVDARVDAEPVRLDRALELPYDRNRLELRFAALSFLEPGRVRYQVRLAPDAPWENTHGQPSFRWVDLPAGRYDAQVRASIDGERWSAQPAHFAFLVLPPWYRTPWALALFAALAGAVLWMAYRARLAYLLGLERQRTRIAMDLHDRLGSGLGSIGILGGLLASDRLDADERGRIAGVVAGTAEELGSALADIVWSLDPRVATLEELAGRLAGHAERFFAGDDVAFRLQAPRTWPAARLPLALRRSLLLIGLEALHNAARHARARNVTLGFVRRGSRWELSVADDGVGMAAGGPRDPRRGRGLDGMRRRASEIGAAIEWSDVPGGGTAVTLRFTLPGSTRQRAAAFRRRLRRRRGA